jgi:hypothetical protein
MANIIPFSFRGALFSGQHDLASGGNTFKLSLYTAHWPLYNSQYSL